MIRYTYEGAADPEERYGDDWTKRLVGKWVNDVRYDGESLFVNFAATECGVKLTPEGDCCSKCYTQHVSNSDVLGSGATIASIEVIESAPSPKELKNIDVLDTRGYRITTNRGTCPVEMRLEHNGYYGGTLEASGYLKWSDAPLLEDF